MSLMPGIRSRKGWVLGVLIGLLLTTAACEGTFVDPFENERRFFTIYGFLDVTQRNHAVRVIPVTRRRQNILSPADAQATLDAIVVSTNLTTGDVVVWQHSLEQLSDGTYGHIFRASFVVREEHTYRLEVHRSDGVMTSAETHVPRIRGNSLFQLGPVRTDSSITQQVTIPDVPSPWGIEVYYTMLIAPAEGEAQIPRFYVPYGRAGARTDEGGWQFRLNLAEDQLEVRRQVGDFVYNGLSGFVPQIMVRRGIRLKILDANWNPPNGIFDAEILAHPGTLSNVENGYGFWGSVGFFQQEWEVSAEFSEMLGYGL